MCYSGDAVSEETVKRNCTVGHQPVDVNRGRLNN